MLQPSDSTDQITWEFMFREQTGDWKASRAVRREEGESNKATEGKDRCPDADQLDGPLEKKDTVQRRILAVSAVPWDDKVYMLSLSMI